MLYGKYKTKHFFVIDYNSTPMVLFLKKFSEKRKSKDSRTIILAVSRRKTNTFHKWKSLYQGSRSRNRKGPLCSRYESVQKVWEQHLDTLEKVSSIMFFDTSLLLWATYLPDFNWVLLTILMSDIKIQWPTSIKYSSFSLMHAVMFNYFSIRDSV